MLLRVFVCIALLGTTAFAEWQRQVSTNKGTWTDSPPPQSLAYFRGHPCTRPNTDRMVYDAECNWGVGGATTPAELEFRARSHNNLRLVGKIGRFTIYDLEYFGPDEDLWFRSVLVEDAPNQLHEIRVQQKVTDTSKLIASEIVHLGQQEILRIQFHDGGKYTGVQEEYFTLDPQGASSFDFKPVFEAAGKVVPEGMFLWAGASKFDFASLTWQGGTEKSDANVGANVACCVGTVTVVFRLVDGRIVATSAKYDPVFVF